MKKKKNERAGADGGFCDRGGQEIVYSDNMGVIASIRIANGALFLEDSGAFFSRKIFEIQVL